jgi:hypothetical protein
MSDCRFPGGESFEIVKKLKKNGAMVFLRQNFVQKSLLERKILTNQILSLLSLNEKKF